MDRAKLISLAMIAFSICLAVGGQFLLKAGMDKVGKFDTLSLSVAGSYFARTFTQPLVLIGLSLYVLSSISWLIVLSRVELSFAYPLVALGYIIAIAISATVLKENVSLIRWVGAIFIGLGVIFISRS